MHLHRSMQSPAYNGFSPHSSSAVANTTPWRTATSRSVVGTTTTTKTRRRRRQSNINRSPIPVVAVLFLFLTGCASSFQVSATKTHPSTHTSESRTHSQLSVSSALTTPPREHLEWLHALEEKNRHHHTHPHEPVQKTKLLEPWNWLSNANWEDNADDIPLEALALFNSTAAKDVWASKYASVDALRETFGRNKNVLWGDLDAVTARRLYKTLLPRALLELHRCQGASSEDLAPLAYRARMAAKQYARERSNVPTRLGACLFDGLRQFRSYGKFQVSGMSYNQIWEKYATQVLEEDDWQDEDDLTSKVCYRILEKACQSNPTVDAILLQEEAMDLEEITRKLEKEVFHLIHNDDAAKQWAVQRYRTLKTLLRIKHRLEHVAQHDTADDRHHHHSQRLPHNSLTTSSEAV